MTPDGLERERAALLALLDTGEPLTDDHRRRIAAVADADHQRAQTHDDLDGRLGRALRDQYAALFAASAITDAVPASMTQDGDRIYVRSRSRGRVQIGRLDYRPLLAVAADRADELEALRRRPLEAKAERKAERRARAHALRAQGKSAPYIARTLNVHVRTVNRYLQSRKTGTDHETPG